MLPPPQTPALPRFELTIAAAGADTAPVRFHARTEPDGALVSCIMPTSRARLAFARNAIRLFLAQDYPDRELIVVTDGDAGELPQDPRIRVVRARRRESIGRKRNRACDAAAGRYVAQWDDDDWHAPGRLTAQLEPLIAGDADITGLVAPLIFDVRAWRFWRVTPALHRRLFFGDVPGGSLVFRRAVWDRLAAYPDASLAEDARFLAGAIERGARLRRIAGAALFMYVRHGANTWRFECGSHVTHAGWLRASEPPLARADREFYAGLAGRTRRRSPGKLVTCIMPTRDRRAFAGHAIAYFARQDHPLRELLILDDGDDPVRDLVPDDSRIRYVRLDRPLVLGAKRNLACELARGDVIAHWDDDDWYAADRLSFQLEALERHGADVCGPARLLFLQPAARRAWVYTYPGAEARWLAGSGLCYRTSAWRRHPFAPLATGEDTAFVRRHRHDAPAVELDGRDFVVGLIHGANSDRKQTSALGWRPHPLAAVRELMGPDFARYERP